VQIVSLNTVRGRLKIPFLCSPEQKAKLQGKKGQADLVLRDGAFYLSYAATVEEAEPFTPQGIIGVDLGLVNVATDSEGNVHTGAPVKRVRRKYRRLRQLLQPKKTRSARKHLQRVRRCESRFVKNENHRISKELVQLALNRQKALACELLTGIRQRANGLNRAMRTELNAWAFLQLKTFLHYKAKRAGVTLIEVDPRYSSQTCSQCGHCERANRRSQEYFCCQCCGYQTNADYNAACNLAARATLSSGLMFRLEALASS
jgi:putative transposase